MPYQFSESRGQGYVLEHISENVPALSGYEYDTHAVYDALEVFSTLCLNRFGGAQKKMVAHNTVSYVPHQSITMTARLEVPAMRVKVSENGLYKARQPIGLVAVHGTYDETHISFYGAGANLVNLVDIECMSSTTAVDGANGLFLAVGNNLTNRAVAGSSFVN